MSLEERNIFLTDLFEMTRGIIVILDNEGRVFRCNPYFENLTGYTSSEIVGVDWFDTFIPENERTVIRDFFDNVILTEFNDGYTNSILTKDGEQHIVEW